MTGLMGQDNGKDGLMCFERNVTVQTIVKTDEI